MEIIEVFWFENEKLGLKIEQGGDTHCEEMTFEEAWSCAHANETRASFRKRLMEMATRCDDTETVYVIRDASGEYISANGGRTPASNEAQEYDDYDDALEHRERATDKVLARDLDA
jgi:hypothetical protein